MKGASPKSSPKERILNSRFSALVRLLAVKPSPKERVGVRLVLLLLLFIKYTAAQQYHFKNLTVADGLGSATINHIFQDSRGYIWFATQGGGVSRFNGKEFKTFTHSQGLISNDVTNIAEDEQGNIWIATANGASQFNGTVFTNYAQAQGFTDGTVYSVCVAHGKIWFATQNDGVKILTPGKGFDSLIVKNGLPSNEVYTIVQAQNGTLIFGLGNGIASYANGKIKLLTVIDKAFFSGCATTDGFVWLGSTGGEVVSVSPDGAINALLLPTALQHDFIGSITCDKTNNLWLGTDHGLLKYDGHKFVLFSEKEGLSINAVQATMVDYENNVWCGTLGGGVNLLTSQAFALYGLQQGLGTRSVNCIYPIPATGKYYVGTAEGLYVFTPGGSVPFKPVTGIKQLEKANITTLAVDSKGLLWVGAQTGVYVVANSNGKFILKTAYTILSKQPVTSVQKVSCAANGDVWIATYGNGAFLLKPGSAKCFNTSTAFASDKILTMHISADGRVWLGTQDAGLFRYSGETFIPVKLPGSKTGKAIWAIAEGKDGELFLGTGEDGLLVYKNGEVKAYTTQQGLTADYISALAWDTACNCLWAGGEKGLDKIEWETEHGRAKVYSYKPQDGFNSRGINQNGIVTGTGGELWLCGVDGLWRYKQQEQAPENVAPKICIEDIRLFYRAVNWQNMGAVLGGHSNLPQSPSLPYNNNHFTFDIQALSAQRVLYTFMLQGQDAAWSEPVENNAITYSNLSPGSYVFKVKAVTRRGMESDDATSFSFTIRPPWWSTWWFYLLIAAALIIALALFIKTRERLLRQQNIKLEETVVQRTKVIAEQKLVVEITLKEKEGLLHEKEVLLKEIHHRVKNNLQTISSMLMLQGAGLRDEGAKKAIAESQNRVRSIALVHQKLYQTDGIEKIELYNFANELTAQLAAVYNNPIRQVNVALSIAEVYISIDTAIPLGLILNELLTNSFKYAFNNTTKGEIKIEVNVNQVKQSGTTPYYTGKAILIYSDNGPGLPTQDLLQNADTLGLRLIKLLSRQIGATLNYSNKTGSVFTFEFSIF